MSRKEDLLFCKIAIANGLLTQEAAQKALALCDKREFETGRRPLIGAIFTKYNLMRNEDVRKIYAAVEKRIGTTRAQIGTVRGRGAATARTGRRERRAKASRPVDPQTMWLGIGGLVAFVVIVGIITVLLLSPGGTKKKGSELSAPEDVKTSGPARFPAAEKPSVSPVATATTTPVPKPAVPEGPKQLPEEMRFAVKQIISDARDFPEPERGLSALENYEKQLREKGYEPPQELLEALQEFREAVKGSGAPSAPGASG